MKKKIMSFSIVITVMFVGIIMVSAGSEHLNVTPKTDIGRVFTANKANLLSVITSDGHGAGTPETYIRAYLKSGQTFYQKLGFKQDISNAVEVSVESGYVGIGEWKLRLFGKNQETGLSYADWSGTWMYSAN